MAAVEKAGGSNTKSPSLSAALLLSVITRLFISCLLSCDLCIWVVALVVTSNRDNPTPITAINANIANIIANI
jgi:hypothetical protein